MKVLFLDLASHSPLSEEGACIACVTDKKTEAIRFVDHRIGDDGLLPMLNEVLKEAGWTEKDLTHIACVNGPGGFTSLRMAVTLANTYSDLLKVPLAAIRLDELYARRKLPSPALHVGAGHPLPIAEEGQAEGSFLWIHATKKQELFVRGFGDYAAIWPDAVLISLENLVAQFPEGASVAGELLPDQRAALAVKNLEDAPLASLADVLPGFLTHRAYADTPIAPWYGRGW